MGFGQLAKNVTILGLVSSGSATLALPATAAMPTEAKTAETVPATPAAEASQEPTPQTLTLGIASERDLPSDTTPSPEITTAHIDWQPQPKFSQKSKAENAAALIEAQLDNPASSQISEPRQRPFNLSSADQRRAPIAPAIRRPSSLSQNAPASELSEPERTAEPLDQTAPILPGGAEPPAETAPIEVPNDPSEDPSEIPSTGGQVAIRQIQVVGSSVFSDRDFASIVAPYEGQNLGLDDLREVADAITQLYLESGYITSRAILGEQTITDGLVQVQVIEGELESIEVEGTERLADYVRDRVNLANRKPLSQIDLESQLQLLRADPLLEGIEASLRAGTGEGQSRLIVRVEEAPAFSGRAVIDTNSPPSVGVVRTGLEANYNNALGLGDQLSLSAYRTTTGGSYAYGIGYSLPLNPMNGTLQLRYLPSSFELVDPALSALDISGASDTYELSFRQPLIRKPSEEFALSLGFRHRVGETLLSDVVIDSTRTSVFQFGQDYLRRDRKGAWGLRSQFSLGTGLLDATERPDGEADGQFFSWLGQVQRAQVISRDNLLLLQGSLQLSPDSLLGAEQFIVGGATSVRGYDQNVRFGDNGVRLSLEDRITLDRNEDGSAAIAIAPFLDSAWVWNNGARVNEQNFLLGTGIGLITNLVDNLQARLDVGVPLVDLNENGDSNQDVFLHFNLEYRF